MFLVCFIFNDLQKALTLLNVVKSHLGMLVWLQLCNPNSVSLFYFVTIAIHKFIAIIMRQSLIFLIEAAAAEKPKAAA